MKNKEMTLILYLLLYPLATFGITNRTFIIDYSNNQFLKDGKPFRYVSGSVHYFRTHPDQWEDRLKTVRAAGLNAIQTYIPWNFHETFKGEYDFSGAKNFTRFFEIAQAYNLMVLVRPGPYICAEWENGGLPYWLLKYPNISLRTSNPDYLREALGWWDVLLPLLKPQLYHNGGPIIMTQLENEYGSFACDKVYTSKLYEKAVEKLGWEAVLYTTDGPSLVECGKIDNVFITVDFGDCDELDGDKYFDIQQKANHNGGPLVNSEYYPGWFVTWGEKKTRTIVPKTTAQDVSKMTSFFHSRNASFNFYMFHGGTNFGFWNGAENSGPLITSYDYWAPMTENGVPNSKFKAVSEVIASWPDWNNKPEPVPALDPAISAKGVSLTKYGNLFDFMPVLVNKTRCVDRTATFEELDQMFGFVKYSFKSQGTGKILNGTNVKDYGFVYVNKQFKGRTSAHLKPLTVETVEMNAQTGDQIDILIENQGRITYLTQNDYKGLVGDLIIDNKVYPAEKINSCPIDIEKLPSNIVESSEITSTFMPGDIYHGEFFTSRTGDTHIDMRSWGKGVVFVNGVNIGRYWSTLGPQYSLYIPAPILQKNNNITIIEMEKLSTSCAQSTKYCTFDLLDSAIPY